MDGRGGAGFVRVVLNILLVLGAAYAIALAAARCGGIEVGS